MYGLRSPATLARIDGTIDDDDAARRLGDDLSRFTREPARMAGSGSRRPARTRPRLVDRAVNAVGTDQLAGYVKSSHPGDDIILILRSLTERLRHVMPGARDWAQAFTDVEAADAVTLMTIHRSKGLEYHTVFFLGLDDDQWWAYQRDADEATSAFFVGLSRAAHRLIFTSTARRPGRERSPPCTRCSTKRACPKPASTDTESPTTEPVPLEYSIEWLTCAFASRLDVVLVSLPGAAQDRLLAHVPGAQPGRPGVPRPPGEGC